MHALIQSNGYPLKYVGKQRASEVLRIGELVEYLLCKGDINQACDEFIKFIYKQENNTRVNRLLIVEDSPETTE
jgi:hypothetical protein